MSDLVISVTLIINADHCIIESAVEKKLIIKTVPKPWSNVVPTDRCGLCWGCFKQDPQLLFEVFSFVNTAIIPVHVPSHP